MNRYIRAVEGSLRNRIFSLHPQRTVVGRGPRCQIQIVDRHLSREHACFEVEGDSRVMLSDLESANGTYVGGARIDRCEVSPGDYIQIGTSAFVYEDTGERQEGLGDDEPLLKVVSRVDLELRREEMAPEPQAPCVDPLHEVARLQGWSFCPVCGEEVNGLRLRAAAGDGVAPAPKVARWVMT